MQFVVNLKNTDSVDFFSRQLLHQTQILSTWNASVSQNENTHSWCLA